MRTAVVIVMMFLGAVTAHAQREEIRWLTLQEAEHQNLEHPRPFILDFYTDWCGWCKHMDKTTYADPVVISFVNRNFYPVKVNAESSDTLTFRGKVYAPVKNGSRYVSGLALEMLGGKLSYPTTVFLYDQKKINLVVPGYLEILKMQGFMVYFSENVWESADINDFLADFEQVFGPEALHKEDTVPSYWTEFSELEHKRLEHKKKILLFLGASWNNSSKMMEKVVFPDSVFRKLADEYFYNLRLDVQSQDSLTFMTHRFVNAGPANNNLHQLAVALNDKVLRVPGIYIFDEEGKLIEHLYYYLDRQRGRIILDYIGSDAFKNMSWDDYLKIKTKETL